MTQPSLPTRNSGLRVFNAALLSALLIMMPFVQLAAASRRESAPNSRGPETARQATDNREQTAAAPENVFANAPVPKPAPEAPALAPVIVATKDDGLATATTVAPGGTINYSVNIKNNGTVSPTDDATGVTFTDIIDAHTTLVVGSAVAAVSDRYNAIGNVRLSIPDGSTDLLANDIDPDTGNNSGMTVTAETKSSTQCTGGCTNNVTIAADGSFTYDPPVGFSGTDTFTYTAHSTVGPGTATETVTITVANEIWFINNNAGACPGAPCDGRLSHPFVSLAAFTAANLGGAGQPGDNDWIFIYESATDYAGPATLRLGQKFIGQDATASLATLTGFPAASGTDQLPVMNSGNGVFVNITGANVNGINLNSGNTLRGFRVGNVGTGTKISGSSFGTLVVGNSGSPDVLLHGTGQALSLTTGVLSNTGGFISVTSTSSATQGISLSGVTDSDGAGAGSFSFGSTTVSGSTTQGILIGTTPADLNFGATSVTGGTNGVSFQNNSGGTRTFGTLGISGSANEAFLHGAGGGNVTVTGAATLSSAGSAISVSAPAATNAINFQAATSATSTGAGATAVNWVAAANASMTFNSLSITRNNGTALNASGNGTINVTTATGSITNTTAGGPAIIAANIALNANFSQINSTAGANGVSLTTVTGTSNLGGGQLTGTSGGSTFQINGGSISVTYSGNITQAAAAPMVTISGGHSSTGPVTFSGTLNASLGQGLQFNNANSTGGGGGGYNFTGTTTLAGGDAGIDILNLSAGSFNFGTGTTITSPTAGPAFNVGTTPGNPTVTYSGSITQNNAQRVINIDGTTGNTITFQTGTITGGASSTGININNANGNVTFSNGMILGTSGSRMTNQALTIANGTGTYNLGAVSIFTNGAPGIVATGADGTINNTSGTVDTTNNRAINIDGPGGLTTLGMTLTTVNSSAGTNGIAILDTNGSFTLAGTVTGSDRCGGLVTVNAVGTPATVTAPVIAECTGGTIQTSTGAGVLINNATNISLSRLRILNPATDGLDINTISGFTLNKSYISDSAGAAGDKGVDINFASGTAVNGTISFTNSFIGPTPHDNFGATISSGTSTWNVTGVVFDDSQLNSGFNFEIRGSSTLSSFTMDGCVLRNQFADGMQMQPNASATATITVANIQNNTFQDNNLGLDLNHDGTANVTYRVINNTFRNHESHAINFFSSAVQAPTTGGTLNGRFEGNAIGTAAINDSGSRIGNGLRVNINGGADSTVTIHNNTIRQTPNGRGMEIISRNGTGGLDATLTNNNVDINFRVTPENAGFSLAAIFLQSNCLAVCNTLRADIRGNTVPAAPPNGELQNFHITLLETGASTHQLVDNSPASANATTELTEAHTNPAHNNTGSAGASAGVALIAGPISTVAMFKPANLNRGYEVAKIDSPTTETSVAARLDASSLVSSTVTSLGRIAEVAVPVAMAKLTSESASEVRTQHAASEGSRDQRSEVRTHHAASSKLETRNTTRDEGTGLRAHYATLSKLATRNATAAPAPMAGETVMANIGTLPAGGSVTITFQVTVENPPNLTLLNPPRVENQGTVSGSNFASVLTDDPNVGGAADKTATQIDLFDTDTNLVSDVNPSNDGDTVTFTATVVETPAQTPNPTGTVDFIDTSNGNAVICNDVALSGGSAPCAVSNLSAGSTHNIEAVYSGDGNFEGSTSAPLAQVVNACAINPVVTTIADTNDGVCDANCSLREAIATVCSAPNNNITFNIDPGTGPHTITLTTGALVAAKNANIRNSSGESITVSGGGTSGVFDISAGKTVSIIGLSITGGSAANGAGVLNNGTLSIVNSTIFSNTATSDGGGIQNTATATSLTLINTTVSSNNANGFGGGVDVLGGTATIINSTITGNHGDNDDTTLGGAGGVRQQGGTVTLHNTIVAGNFKGSGTTTPNDIEGVVTGSNNLVGDAATSGGLTHGTNGNIVGNAGVGTIVITTVLNTMLATNGGLTATHALVANGPAVEAGSNANLPTDTFDLDGDANVAETLPVDQRGVGYPRTADSADANTTQTVDIGAFELHPSVEDITDKTTAEDTAVPQITFNLGDGTGALISTVTATSGNTTLVPNANILVGGSGSTRTLDITPAADANSPADGTATITVTVTATNGRTAVDTFVVTVTEVNDAPVPTNDTVSDVAEDSGTYVIPFATLLSNDTNKGAANESGQTLNITAVSSPTGGGVAINGTNVEFTPTADYSGPAGFTYTVTDDGTTNLVSDPKTGNATVSFNVTAVNDPPSFTIAADPPAVNEDAGAQTVNSFATSISAGPGETQTLTFNITPTGTTGNLSFASGPAIDTSTGNLTYTTNADTNGTASFSVTLSDNGGGTDTSAPQTFTITVNAVDDAPTFTLAAGPTVAEDAGAQSVPSFASNFQPGPATATDESTQTLVGYALTQTGSTGGLTFSGTPAIDNAGTLTYTATGNTSGTATFDVVATDTGSNTPPNVNQSAPQSFTITVSAANDAPVNTVPGPQGTASNTPLIFSIGNGNQISVADADAGTSTVQVTLTATNGTLTLNGTTGLNFGCGGCAGDGTADATMTFQGTLTDINAALNGLTYTPNVSFSGPATLTITSNDLGNTGSGGALSDTDVVNIQVATEIRINDGSSIEPASPNTIDMVFTVSLNSPAVGTVSVNFTTQDEPAGVGKAVAGTCGSGGDYVATNGTVTFTAGQQVKAINVPICSDAVSEPDETFRVLLSGETGGTLIDGNATGTIKSANTAGAVLISELRTSGPGGSADDFVEIYNNSNSPLTVAATDSSAGYGVYKMGADCNATPVLLGVIPNGTIIPARGHYLLVGSAYTLTNYGGTGAAAGNLTMTADIETDANVGLFSTSDLAGISSANRLDAVGFGLNTGNVCNLLREADTLPSVAGNATTEHSFFRKMCDWQQGLGCTVPGVPKDTNNNLADFWLADTAATNFAPGQQRLGAPGPENIASPIRRDNANNPGTGGIDVFRLDGTVGTAAEPNRTRNGSAPEGTFGTMVIRHRVVNNTGGNVTRLRYRIVDMSTALAPVGPTADLRALTSVIESTIGPVNDSATCTAAGAGSPPCTVAVQATTLETPPAQAIGGGYNSTLSSGTITTGTPLTNGSSILINFRLGVEKTGSFRFFIIVEALP
ncbi:MAG TPA: Ig-like domain-containing protein [Pyrinomonadaceae bacterium]|nr:Ig-like domain-containing protein [Pyrinomonadaceae bacterium]